MSTRSELKELHIPDLKNILKSRGIRGYTGKNKDALIDMILNPPPPESQRSPGRPKTSKAVPETNIIRPAPVGVIEPTMVPGNVIQVPTPSVPVPQGTIELKWNKSDLAQINLNLLKALAVKLGIKGLSGKPKAHIVETLSVHRLDQPVTIASEEKTYRFAIDMSAGNVATETRPIVPPQTITTIAPVTRLSAIPFAGIPMKEPLKQLFKKLKYAPTFTFAFSEAPNAEVFTNANVGSVVSFDGDDKQYVVVSVNMDESGTYSEKVLVSLAESWDPETKEITYDELKPKIELTLFVDHPTKIGWGANEMDSTEYRWI